MLLENKCKRIIEDRILEKLLQLDKDASVE